MMKTIDPTTPARNLLGKELSGGWEVVKLVNRPPSATGGHFSCSYIVRSKDGKEAFLKAMDYTRALQSPNPAVELQAMTAAYNYEKDLLEKCNQRQLSRIINLLHYGAVPAQVGEPASVVEYLILELAKGDVRVINAEKTIDTAFALRTIHNVAAALQQLHLSHIAHQDVKPSNVLTFDSGPSKLGDLGRAVAHHDKSPHDEKIIAGDTTYAPPELLYGFVPGDWTERRLGCDMYLLGSLGVFFFTGASMTHLLFAKLSEEFHYKKWRRTYDEVLPYIQNAFLEAIREIKSEIPPEFSKTSEAIQQLCNPDPELRGHPKNIVSGGNQYSLERYISIFGNLAKRAELSLQGRIPISHRNSK